MLLVVIVARLTSLHLFVAIRNSSAIDASANIGVYWDIACAEPVETVRWGVMSPSESKDVIVHVRNEGNTSFILLLSQANINPQNASDYLSFTWAPKEYALEPNQVVQTTLSLLIFPNTTGVRDFQFDIIFEGRNAPAPTGSISGKITDSIIGSAISGANVTVSGSNFDSMFTDSEGHYNMSNLLPGQYSVSASKLGYSSQTKPTTVSAGGTTTLDFQLQPILGSIDGRVVDNLTGLGIGGASITASGPSPGSAISNLDGSYIISYLYPGQYSVSVSHFNYFGQSKSATVTSGSITGIDFQLQPIPSTKLRADLNSDGIVNIIDVTIVALAYMSVPGDTNWNPITDLDNNDLINILDVTAVAIDYGKTA